MNEYLVRLTLPAKGDNPHDAVLDFLHHVLSDGLLDWIYRVEDGNGNIAHLDGRGKEFVVPEVEALAQLSQELDDGKDPVTDEVLLDLARKLTGRE